MSYVVTADRAALENRQLHVAMSFDVTDKLTIEFIDPLKHPQVVQEKNLSQTGPRVFFKSGTKEVRAKDTSEEALTNASSLTRVVFCCFTEADATPYRAALA